MKQYKKTQIDEAKLSELLVAGKPQLNTDWEQVTLEKLERLQNFSSQNSPHLMRNIYNYLNIIFTAMSKNRKHLFIVVSIVCLVLVIAGIFGSRLLMKREFTAAEQREILAQIIQRNSAAAIRSPQTSANANLALSDRTAAAGGVSEAAADSQLAPFPMLPPSEQDFNYVHTISTYQPGPAAGRCQALGNQTEGQKYENYQFNEGDKNYYVNITSFADGSLNNYSFNQGGSSESEFIEYRGGKFAVRMVYKHDIGSVSPERSLAEPQPADLEANTGGDIDPDEPEAEPTTSTESSSTSSESPSSETTTTKPETPETVTSGPTPEPTPTPEPETPPTEPDISDDLIKQYFGENAQVKTIVSENGKDYFLVEYSFPIDCNQSLELLARSAEIYRSQNTTNNIVYVSWVDTTNFSVYKGFTYLDNTSEPNLIDTNTNTGEYLKTDFNSVANNFKFNYNVELRTLDTSKLNPTAEEQAQNTLDYLSSLDTSVIVLDNPAFTNSIYATDPTPKLPEGWDYYTDRNYYPSGTRGDKMLADATPQTSDESFVYADYSANAYMPNAPQYLNIGGYKSSVSDAELLKSSTGEYTEVSSENINVSVNGQQVAAKVITTETNAMSPLMREGNAASGIAIPDSVEMRVAADCAEDKCTITQKYIIFTYEKTKILISVSEETDVTNLKFKSYNPKNATDLSILRTIIMQALRGETKPGATGGGSSSSAPDGN